MPDLLSSDRLIVNQKAKIVEVTNQYFIRDDQGEEFGYMQQEGQSTFRKVLRFATDVDQFLTHRLALYDTSGSKLLQIVRPARSSNPSSASRMATESWGPSPSETSSARSASTYSTPAGESWGGFRPRTGEPGILRSSMQLVMKSGGSTKFVGVLNAVFTPADNYIVDIDPGLTGELRLPTIAAAIAVDTALTQDARGFSVTDVFE
ncbi:hypothetical protein BH20ACT21_BH20ACT21_05840 [soil metagenome]